MDKKKIVFSGIQPTGNIHLGNYTGAIRQWAAEQADKVNYFCVVDLHSLTVPQNPEQLRFETRSLAALLLACGIDPQQSTIFIQSHVTAHAEGCWLLNCVTPLLRMNMDTGNTFIAGQDPVAFLQQFKDKVSHVHVKDVSQSLAAAMRGELTGIAVSQTAIGDGVNGDNIRRCFDILVDIGYDGVVSIECEGQGGPMIEKSLAWVREVVDEANEKLRVTNDE